MPMRKPYKLPYIKDPALFHAVTRACSWIRKEGCFNRAVNWCAREYGVDADEVARLVRHAQGVGQKIANAKRPPRKYQWFAIEFSLGNERHNCDYFIPEEARYFVAKGLTEDSVTYRLYKDEDPSDEYQWCTFTNRVKGFPTKDEALKQCREWYNEQHRNYAMFQSIAFEGQRSTVLSDGRLAY